MAHSWMVAGAWASLLHHGLISLWVSGFMTGTSLILAWSCQAAEGGRKRGNRPRPPCSHAAAVHKSVPRRQLTRSDMHVHLCTVAWFRSAINPSPTAPTATTFQADWVSFTVAVTSQHRRHPEMHHQFGRCGYDCCRSRMDTPVLQQPVQASNHSMTHTCSRGIRSQHR